MSADSSESGIVAYDINHPSCHDPWMIGTQPGSEMTHDQLSAAAR